MASRNKRSLNEEEARQLEQDLMHFTGTTRWFRHWSNMLLYTEGVQHLAEKAKAYWLIDVIASWQTKVDVSRELFQVWQLRMASGEEGRDEGVRTAFVEMGIDQVEDGRLVRAMGPGGHPSVYGPVCSQEIPYTDFPLADGIKLYVEGQCPNAVLMLPSER